MTVDILTHEFVPSHDILPKKEAKELLEGLHAEAADLPRILLTDPVVKRIGAKEGDILRIARKSPTAGTAVYYRVVV